MCLLSAANIEYKNLEEKYHVDYYIAFFGTFLAPLTFSVRNGHLRWMGKKNVFFQITLAVGVDRSFRSYQEVPWMFPQVSDILREY